MEMTVEEAQAYHDAYIGELPSLVERLRRRVERTGGPELDGSLEGLGPLGAWFVDQLAKDEPDGLEGPGRLHGARAALHAGRGGWRMSEEFVIFRGWVDEEDGPRRSRRVPELSGDVRR